MEEKYIIAFDMEKEDVIELKKAMYESESAVDLLAVALKNIDKDNISKELVDELYKKSLEKFMELRIKKDEMTDKYITEEYKSNKYRWVFEDTRDRLLLYSNDEEK